MSQRHILLMDGPDHKGLIYHVTRILFAHNQNIISNDEYVSPSRYFFMRTEFEGDTDIPELLKALQSELPAGLNLRINPKKNKDIVLMVTKEHHCLGELLIRYAFNELDATIMAVISNYNTLQPLVGKFGIPFHFISHENKTREEHEEAISRTLDIYRPDYVVLAKYMRIITPQFVERFPNRIVNIHHSFLPAFIGANPYRQAYERGVKIIGATAHFVNNDLDEGPIIAQDVKEVDHKLTASDMATLGKDTEKAVLSKALKLVFNDRVFIHHNRTIIL
ncbi:formyltetrahydrofolate deformylase [Dyadobacter sp. BE34]|uniref:Formyltetrahydrofolate deformylase n=1 Tax=Dyadobacter fermentans TaxID=94254 RepID=A0ABU1R363_9BACT|nr:MULTISPECIES: formyltetrahydrofolate deformylase [Dyadobacter]MDR6807854.1 formyltetrahydrofolate deformylase [Dyadobacter fermentans]MDR7045595.1 formyltetrahydrofolate deformylase [Dyadobacter sp. BE242]MDR7199908.1 formyltetrahydrofolate deformylase [Dyadobacter sp. BE34]MDR7217633.1 formyltetrahydrofolate deformylase [Dyadobacter sp. BE31]MDR7265799.1 formyltetrahydrofolate deformylase [Dyadobacter sp. BE32]